MSSCFSLASLYESFIRCSLTASGLSSQIVDVDADTTVHFWGPTPSSSQSKNGVSKKSSIVLIQGFGPHGVWQWRQQVSFLAPYFNVYVPDLVFFGESKTKSSERSEIFQAEVIGKLMEKAGVDKYSVVGTSYGGFVAYRLAEMWPERVEKVVVASSGINMRPIDNVEIMKKANVETIDELMLPETAGQLRKLMRFAANISRLYVPDCILNDFIEEVLIIWGDQDNIFPVDMAKELKEMLGKKASLEVMKKASHLLQIQQARNFNKIIYSFLCASS